MLNKAKSFIPNFLFNWYHFFLALLGAVLYRFPSKRLIVIGVTGTNGKSTVVHLTDKILEEAGHRVAALSSIRFKIGNKERQNILKMTMPGRFRIQKFLREAVNNGCKYAVIEVTSEGIKQHRHRFIDFDVAVLTNLTPEHIESHGSFEKYREAKAKLFQSLANSKHKILNPKQISNSKCKIPNRKVLIINLDDESADYFLKFPAKEKYGYKISSKFKAQSSNLQPKVQNLLYPENCQINQNGISFTINSTQFNLNLLGEFNIYNSLAAICVGLSQGISLEICKKALEKVKGIPGRMEEVIKEPFRVIVDYAHTPDALQKVYKAIRNFKVQTQSSKLICVLGACGGGRDKWKRPKMGEIAAEYCNRVILTNEDPYDENPEKILDEIFSGFSSSKRKTQNSKLYKILDRGEAIKKALTLAESDDVVIITGKGCEPWMCVAKGEKIPWDDRKVVKEKFYELKTKY